MKQRLSILVAVLVLAGAGPVFAWEGAFFDLFQIPFSPREAALGGVHAAQADDISTLVSNPAGFRSAGPDLTIGTVTLSIYDSAPAMIDQVLTSQPDVTPGIQRSTANVLGPLSLGYVGDGFGFGLFANTNLRTWTWGAYPAGRAVAMQNLVMVSGYAFRIPLPEQWASTLDLGFSVPFLVVGRSDTNKDVRGLFASLYPPMDFIANQPFIFATGVGIEAGILYSWNNRFSVGIAARDLAIVSWQSYPTLASYLAGDTPATTNTPIPMDVSAGIRWSPRIKDLIRSIDGLTFMADYNDILDFLIYPPGARNWLLHFGLGMEITLLKVVKLRAGFYQLLPSGGIALDLGFFTLDAAVFGRELSKEPWGYPVYGYMASIRFRT
jgi:hypothetical protein